MLVLIVGSDRSDDLKVVIFFVLHWTILSDGAQGVVVSELYFIAHCRENDLCEETSYWRV